MRIYFKPIIMVNNLKDLIPANLTHPGETLADELKARKMTQHDFANIIGVKQPYINMIIKGQRPINVKMAYRIGVALGIDSDVWINLQKNYEQDKARKDKNFIEKLKQIGIRKFFWETEKKSWK